jgi:hypothetical protein
MLRIEKNWWQKSDFLNFLCRESKKLHLVKKSLASVFFCAESFLFGSRQRSLCAEFFLCREFFISLSVKPSLPRVFYLALGTETKSGQSLGFR